MLKEIKVKLSLIYEILLYLNYCYLILFIGAELALGGLKVFYGNYPEDTLMIETTIFFLLQFTEYLRLRLGRRGNLKNQKAPVFMSILLLVPSVFGVCFFLMFQTYIVRFEYILCVIMLIFHMLEFTCATLFLVTT